MKKTGRYDTSKLIEDQSEPGSSGRVLRNLLGIKRKNQMDRVEAEELKRAEDTLIRTYDQNYRFTALDVCKIHKLWLGTIYEWAGHYRQVNLVKGDFPFATAAYIPQLMASYEQGPLREHTPCTFRSRDRIVQALAGVHAELILIHPFREGNGRVARLLATLMALQAGFPPLDFWSIRGKKLQQYFEAVQASLDRNYKPMEAVFSSVLERTLTGRSSA